MIKEKEIFKTSYNLNKDSAMDWKKLKNETFLYPTDTTFGLGCDAFNEALVKKIYHIKQRAFDKKCILLTDSAAHLMDLVNVPEIAWDLMEVSEKPLTIIYDEPLTVPTYLLSEEGTIAIRLTKDMLCKKIIQNFKNPIISTSANLSEEKSPKSFEEINPKILEKIDYIFPECKTFAPLYSASSIIQVSEGGLVKVIRQ